MIKLFVFPSQGLQQSETNELTLGGAITLSPTISHSDHSRNFILFVPAGNRVAGIRPWCLSMFGPLSLVSTSLFLLLPAVGPP